MDVACRGGRLGRPAVRVKGLGRRIVVRGEGRDRRSSGRLLPDLAQPGHRPAQGLGKPRCLEVAHAPNLEQLCFDAAFLELPMGTVPMEVYSSDYREVDGIRIAHQGRVVVLGQERLVTTESIEHNVELAADRFTPPADVQTLLERRAASVDRE